MSATCSRLCEEAAELAALEEDHPRRAAAAAHARGCPGCAGALREADRLRDLLGVVIAGPGSPEGAWARGLAPGPAAVAERLAAELRRESRRRAWAGVAAAGAVAGLVLVAARHRATTPANLLVAAFVLAAALALALAARRGRGAAALVAVGVALVAALGGGRGALLSPAIGFHCFATEAAAALVVVAAVALALRGSATRLGRSAAATAGAGALAAAAALQLACPVVTELPHQLAFHLGGVAAVVAGGWFAFRRLAA